MKAGIEKNGGKSEYFLIYNDWCEIDKGSWKALGKTVSGWKGYKD